jgi:predicted molibdopterin-dependent oxidoreductase YjgC
MGITPAFGPGYSQTTAGLSYAEMLGANGQTPLKALLVLGANPVSHLQELGLSGDAITNLELLVVQELFMSETAERAHVVLPSASFAEKDGTFTNTEGRVQQIAAAIQPLQGTAPDAAILLELAGRLGADVKTRNSQGLFEEIARTTQLYKGLSFNNLGQEGMLRPLEREAQAENLQIPDWLQNATRPQPEVLIGTANAELEQALEASGKAQS